VAEVRRHIEREYRDVRVEGEISGCRKAASGHVYFTLKDDQSQIPVVLFRGKARLLRFEPKDGLEVTVRGAVSVYEDRGQLQLVAEAIEPRGKGSLQLAFEQLYDRLRQEGLFDAERKRPLPAYPRVVGVITSAQGAVIHDILNVMARRHAKVQILLYPVAVQGEAAAGEIVAALQWFAENRCADLLLLARGGGSLEDLAPFNSEAVARAVAAAAVPIVCAVGHETDFSLAEFAADLRAPTPSAAAELITDALYRVEERLDLLWQRLERAARYQRMRARERYAALDVSAVFARLQHGLARRQQRVDELRFRMETLWDRQCGLRKQTLSQLQTRLMQQDVRRQLALQSERLRGLDQRLTSAGRLAVERCSTPWRRAADRLAALSPLAVLERGYALAYVEPASGAPTALVKDAAQLGTSDTLHLRFARGRARARVIETEQQRGEDE
jgi:exodeoxyribonuclease VII large subunit